MSQAMGCGVWGTKSMGITLEVSRCGVGWVGREKAFLDRLGTEGKKILKYQSQRDP
jgi:hypothetical protein